MYATGTEGVEAGEQAGLVVIVVADAAGEGIPGSAARHARCTIVADPIADRRARARHHRAAATSASASLSIVIPGKLAFTTSLLPVAPYPCTPSATERTRIPGLKARSETRTDAER